MRGWTRPSITWALALALGVIASSAHAQAPTEDPALVVGAELSAVLELGDTEAPGGGFVERFVLNAEAGDRVQISVHASAFEPWVRVVSPHRAPVTPRVRAYIERATPSIEFVAAVDGQYSVFVGAEAPGATGEFSIAVNAYAASVRAGSTRLQWNTAHESTLLPTQTFLFAVPETQWVEISADATDAGIRVSLEDVHGTLLDEVDTTLGDVLNGRGRVYTRLHADEYVLRVSAPNGLNPPPLRVTVGPGVAPELRPMPITLGQVISGTIVQGDFWDSVSGMRLHAYDISLEDHVPYALHFTDSEAGRGWGPIYIRVLRPDGRDVPLQHFGRQHVEFSLDAPGVHRVIVSSGLRGQSYTLQLRVGEAAPAVVAPLPIRLASGVVVGVPVTALGGVGLLSVEQGDVVDVTVTHPNASLTLNAVDETGHTFATARFDDENPVVSAVPFGSEPSTEQATRLGFVAAFTGEVAIVIASSFESTRTLSVGVQIDRNE